MSPLPKFEVMGREVRAKGVLSGSNYQWFNRRITDDAPYLGLTGREAEEAEGVAADDFNNIGWGEAKGA